MRLYSVPMLMFIFSMLGCSADEKSGDEQGWEDDDQTWSDAENNCEAESTERTWIQPLDSISFRWHSEYNAQFDQVGRVFAVEVLVCEQRDASTGPERQVGPAADVELEVVTGYPGVLVMSPSSVREIEYSEEQSLTNWEQLQDRCHDVSGDPSEECLWFWDFESGKVYESDYWPSSSNYAPNYFVGRTNADGKVSILVVVDAMPVYGNSEASMFGSVQITMSIGVDMATLELGVEED